MASRNLRQIGIASLIYASDHGDKLPMAEDIWDYVGELARGDGSILTRLKDAVVFARARGKMVRDDSAAQLWAEAYPALTAVRPHLFGMADSSFEEAVDLMLAALAARAPAGRDPGGPSR